MPQVREKTHARERAEPDRREFQTEIVMADAVSLRI
jgi:hypothetical protein